MIMVSVVIPIYNVSQYIDRGLKYILAQDYPSFEIILVDDGSTDDSASICDDWAVKDSHIKVLHKKNAGAGSARNVGIDQAKGEYIYFFDIDDKIPSNLLSTLVSQIEESLADMMVFGYNSIDIKYKTITRVSIDRQLLESNRALRDVFVDEFVLKVNGFPWNKLYRKSFLDKYNLRFENQRIQQDEVFNLKCYRHVNRMLLSESVLYDYYVYDRGNTRSRFIPERFDIYKSVYRHFCELRNFWALEDGRFDSYLHSRLFINLNDLLRHNLVHPKCPWNRDERKAEIDRVMNDRIFQDAIAFKELEGMTLESKLFLLAYRMRSIFLIRIFNSIFSGLRSLKHLIA